MSSFWIGLEIMSKGSKRSQLTLDLSSAQATTRKTRLGAQNAEVLTSPDVQMLKLSSPQLEAFLVRDPAMPTPTPSASGYTFPTTVKAEQELYVKGFEMKAQPTEAVTKQQHMMSGGLVASAVPASLPTTIAEIPTSIEVKREDLEAVATPPSKPATRGKRTRKTTASSSQSDTSNISPIDMDAQERIKLERKRLRNRLAADKCRKRKLERISNLDDKVKELKAENVELGTVLKKLKESVCDLKQEVMDHMNSGCQINMMA